MCLAVPLKWCGMMLVMLIQTYMITQESTRNLFIHNCLQSGWFILFHLFKTMCNKVSTLTLAAEAASPTPTNTKACHCMQFSKILSTFHHQQPSFLRSTIMLSSQILQFSNFLHTISVYILDTPSLYIWPVCLSPLHYTNLTTLLGPHPTWSSSLCTCNSLNFLLHPS